MNATSPPTSVLLDKSVLREALRAISRLLIGQRLPDRQFLSLAAISVLIDRAIPSYVTQETAHILQRPHISQVAQALTPQLRVLTPGRYLRRWARRLREEGFGREDATLVSYGSFGLDPENETFGADVILTTDDALKARFDRLGSHLRRRFDRMTRQLATPYREAELPILLGPTGILDRSSR